MHTYRMIDTHITHLDGVTPNQDGETLAAGSIYQYNFTHNRVGCVLFKNTYTKQCRIEYTLWIEGQYNELSTEEGQHLESRLYSAA